MTDNTLDIEAESEDQGAEFDTATLYQEAVFLQSLLHDLRDRQAILDSEAQRLRLENKRLAASNQTQEREYLAAVSAYPSSAQPQPQGAALVSATKTKPGSGSGSSGAGLWGSVIDSASRSSQSMERLLDALSVFEQQVQREDLL